MVKTIGSVEPRSSGTIELQSQLTTDGRIRPNFNEQRHTYRFISTLDVFAEIRITGTHSTDPEFDNADEVNSTVPLPSGTVRNFEYTQAYELLKFEVITDSAPTTGRVSSVLLQDNGTPTHSESVVLDEDINQGKSFFISESEQILDGNTTSIGIKNPSSSETPVVISELRPVSFANGTLTYEIDHGSYTGGTDVDAINTRPELQVEQPLQASVTKNPTVSNPQKTTNGLQPGGKKEAGSGGATGSARFILDPGQDLVVKMTNVSGGENRFGFTMTLVEKIL